MQEGVIEIQDSSQSSDAGDAGKSTKSEVTETEMASASASSYQSVLVAYTAQAGNAVGNISSTVQTLIDATNASYSASGINFQLALASRLSVTYNEQGTLQDHVNRMRDDDDGVLDHLHFWRDDFVRADMVVMLVADNDNNNGCGSAFDVFPRRIGDPPRTSAFAVVNIDCAITNLSFAHEIGHLQGAQHDEFPGVPQNDFPFNYGHGHVSPSDAWRTIMAYGDACNFCQRDPVWSNPSRTHLGEVQGTSTANNARVLRETENEIASYSDSPTPYVVNLSQVPEPICCPSSSDIWNAGIVGSSSSPRTFKWYVATPWNSASLKRTRSTSGTSDGFSYYPPYSFYLTWVRVAAGGVTVSMTRFNNSLWSAKQALATNTTTEANSQITIDSGESKKETVPSEYMLHQNYPNPFNLQTRIGFELPKASHARLSVYDVTGREVARPVDAFFESGHYSTNFEALDLPSGIYLYRLEADSFTNTGRMTLVK